MWLIPALLLACSGPGRCESPDIQSLDIQARSLGLGRSAAALFDYAAAGNPAALGREPAALAASQARLAYDRYGYRLLAVIPFRGALGIRFDQLIVQNQAYRRLLYNPDGTPIIDPLTNQQAWELKYDTEIESLLGLAYGLSLLPGVCAGVEGQAVHLKVGEDFAWGFDAAAGVNLETAEGVSLGVLMRRANGGWHAWRVPYGEASGRPELQAGAAWEFKPWRTLVTASLVQILEWNTLPRGRAGAEYAGFAPLILRAGWDADHANLGAGFAWQAVTVDYAAVIGGALYDANRITVKVQF